MSDERDPDTIDEEEREPPILVCQQCGSPDIRRRRRLIPFLAIAAIAIASGYAFDQAEAAFFFVLAAAVFALVTDVWVCEECGESWK